MKYLTFFSAIVVLALSGCCGHEKEKKLLFVLHAQNAVYSNGRLILDGVDTTVAYFTDRPVRQAGTFGIEHFLSSWDSKKFKNSYEENPPNAAVVSADGKEEKYSEVSVELISPKYDPDRKQLIFDVRLLGKRHFPENQSLHEISLFVDDGGCPSGNPGWCRVHGYSW